jgi:hypothetical protein
MVRLFRVVLGILLAFLLTCPLKAAEVYHWKDAEGNVHFTDDLTQVPESQRDKVDVLFLPETTLPQRPSEQGSAVSPPTGERLEEESEDPLVTCQERIREEVARSKKQLAEDSRRIEEITREIHLTATARKKNELQRVRAELKRRIEDTQTMLETVLPSQARECRMEPDW